MPIKSLFRSLFPNWLVNHLWHLPKAILANLYYQFPSKDLKIIGITGTSGKTTTAHILYHLLLKSGYKVALISTISAKIGQKEIDIGLHVTNPDPSPLQKLLKTIKSKGYTHVILEVTSHGLDQHRVWGIHFTYGAVTNITHEHLDYHGRFSNYKQAKLKLLKNSSISVLNQSDPSFQAAKKVAPSKVLTFQQDKDFQITNFNTASVIAQDLGISKSKIAKDLKSFSGIPGRMEVIQKSPFHIIIDFAHKPDALKKALTSLNTQKGKTGKTITVFGCAGLRDVQKRPLMGAISAKLANITILTAEDPRTEDVNHIINQIRSGWEKAVKLKSAKLIIQPDRQKAINQAISLAKKGDLVALFGKSHEKSMCFGTIEYPWSEHQAVKKALKQRSEQ